MPTSAEPSTAVPGRSRDFQSLMPYRIREVLLVASRYDSFILEEEGKITDLILEEYDRLNLRYAPRLNATPNAREALELLASDLRFDLVIVTLHPEEMDPSDFARAVKRMSPRLPVVLLGYDNRELQELRDSADAEAFDHIFIWTGDARILLAIVSLIEDARNVEHDTKAVGVEAIIFVEDSIHFISSVLPIMYGILMKQSQRLIHEGITLSHKVLRTRARPKILHAASLEEAWNAYEKYRANILGVISDVRFRRRGESDPSSGAEFARRVREDNPDVPILLQSSDPRNARIARAIRVNFVEKQSPQLPQEIERFMLDSFGFGPFLFRLPDGSIVGTANDLAEFSACLATIPAESVLYHTEHNHFSTWLKARTEFELAASLRPKHVSDYASVEDMRRSIIGELAAFRRDKYRHAIIDFNPDSFGPLSTCARIGGGSLGGKARGLAFLNRLLRDEGVAASFPEIDVGVPPMVVIGTELFDRFIEHNTLTDVADRCDSDEDLRRIFLEARLPADLVAALSSFVDIVQYPCAVRSSSLLEDSQHQPFAGVYETYMIPNNSPHQQRRLEDLCAAVKLVYASTFSRKAKTYLEATPQRPEKEKMAVIIQQLMGRAKDGRFYPSFSGVAQSYNYYPFGRVEPHDGAARVALGLGRTVVEGRGGLRFCPRYPRHLPQFSSVEDILANAQKDFDALPLDASEADPHVRFQPRSYPIEDAHGDPALAEIGSIYAHEDHAIHDGVARPGTPLVTFAGVLKYQRFPLAALLTELLCVGTRAMSTPVEIEFAVDLDARADGRRSFALLQVRPLTVARELSRIDLNRFARPQMLCSSPRALGNGRIEGIRDVVCIVPDLFDRRNSARTAAAVAELNAVMRSESRPYMLIGPGRWGSADPWLGVPVNWAQISGARIIVETGFSGVVVTPSEGSHFFHNMTAFHVGYMTTNPDRGEGHIDWDWLLGNVIVREGENGLRWIRLREPLLGLIDGETRVGVVLKEDVVAKEEES